MSKVATDSQAIEALLGFATGGPNIWVGSAVLEAEIARDPDSDGREMQQMRTSLS